MEENKFTLGDIVSVTSKLALVLDLTDRCETDDRSVLSLDRRRADGLRLDEIRNSVFDGPISLTRLGSESVSFEAAE